MASNELIIDDDYCRGMGTYFVRQGERLDELTREYISILEEVKGKAITSGEVSSALSVYITYVKKLNNQISDISTSVKNQIDQFLAQVDSEDQYIF